MINALLYRCLPVLENKVAGKHFNELELRILRFSRLLDEVGVKS